MKSYAVVDRVLEACRRHGKVPGFLATDMSEDSSLLDRGIGVLAYGGDLWIYQAALQQGVLALQQHAR